MDAPFSLPRLLSAPGPDGFAEEVQRYRVHARPKPKFHTLLDARRLFPQGGSATVTTRVRPEAKAGERCIEVLLQLRMGNLELDERFEATWSEGIVAERLLRTAGDTRTEDVHFARGALPFPPSTYPDTIIPFLMRGQPFDGQRRALHAWTSDRFVARVYYETRGKEKVTVPAGTIECAPLWMYPDLNDWVSLGSVLSRLAKPLLPRYEMWFELAAPHRVVRFEGAFGPPGAPEVVMELEP